MLIEYLPLEGFILSLTQVTFGTGLAELSHDRTTSLPFNALTKGLNFRSFGLADESNKNLEHIYSYLFNTRSLLEKIVTRSLEGGGGQSDPPSTFDTIQPVDLKFGTYNKLHLYFQLSETMWCLIGFHGNNSQINDVTGGRLLGFSNFQILFNISLLYLRLTGKQHLAVEINEIGQIHCGVVSI